MAETARFLQSHALFGGVDDTGIRTLLDLLEEETFPRGAFLFRQGDVGDRLYFILEGAVEVISQNPEEPNTPDLTLAIRRIGDSFGEMALIDIQRRSASVRAVDAVRVLSLSHHALLQLYQDRLELFTLIILNIAREISRRLRELDAQVSSSLFCPPAGGHQSTTES